ncbi:MAG: hypothetical protein IPL32_17815 [Chloracidobacterium sp.]|nr:hypothetical protein [Chloracidobacterium sp.]
MKNISVVTEVQTFVVAAGEQGPPGPAGANGSSGNLEPVSVYNFGNPEIVFTKEGDVVTNDAT